MITIGRSTSLSPMGQTTVNPPMSPEWDAMREAHPDWLPTGLAAFALDSTTPVFVDEVPCPVCGVMLNEEHKTDG